MGQLIFVGLLRGKVSLRSPRLPDDPAGLALAQPIPLTSYLNRLPASLGAYNFPWAISRRTCFSSDRSATSFFSRPFSSSSCLSRFLINVETAVFLAPSIKRLLRRSHFFASYSDVLALALQHLNLPQLGDNLLGT